MGVREPPCTLAITSDAGRARSFRSSGVIRAWNSGERLRIRSSRSFCLVTLQMGPVHWNQVWVTWQTTALPTMLDDGQETRTWLSSKVQRRKWLVYRYHDALSGLVLGLNLVFLLTVDVSRPRLRTVSSPARSSKPSRFQAHPTRPHIERGCLVGGESRHEGGSMGSLGSHQTRASKNTCHDSEEVIGRADYIVGRVQ